MTRSHSRIVGIDELMQGFGNVEDTIAPAIMDMSETPFDPNNNTSTMDADSTTGKDVGLVYICIYIHIYIQQVQLHHLKLLLFIV